MSESTSDRDNIKQPQDHLPPADDRGADVKDEPNEYPGVGAPDGTTGISPATAAEPERPLLHGAGKLPQSGH